MNFTEEDKASIKNLYLINGWITETYQTVPWKTMENDWIGEAFDETA